MAERVRWGILGAARIAASQLAPAVRRSRRGVLVAVAARERARAEAFAAEHGVARVHDDYEALLADPEVDAVYVPLPNGLHARWTAAAARAGKHVLCEKPFAANALEAADAARAAARAGVVCMEAFVYRSHPQTLRVGRWLRGGEIGEVRAAHAAFHFVMRGPRRRTDLRTDATLAGGSLMDVGCYAVSWMRFVFGEEPVAVSAAMVWDAEQGVDSQVVGLLHFSGGRAGTVSGSFDIPGTVASRIQGTGGEVVVAQPYHPRGEQATVILRRNGEAEETHNDTVDGPTFGPAVEHFHDCVLDGARPRLTPADAVANMAVIDALYASARAGGGAVPVRAPSPAG